jgi:hypothetical protein
MNTTSNLSPFTNPYLVFLALGVCCSLASAQMTSEDAECIAASNQHSQDGGGWMGFGRTLKNKIEGEENLQCLSLPPTPEYFDPCALTLESGRPNSYDLNQFKNRAHSLEEAARALFQPNRTPFNSADDAAKAALSWINGTSIDEGVEYAGRIYQETGGSGKYFFSSPVAGSSNDSDSNSSRIPAETTVVGTYHTHGGGFDATDEFFSAQDILKAAMSKHPAYLVTPRGVIQRFEPKSDRTTDTECATTKGNGTIHLL